MSIHDVTTSHPESNFACRISLVALSMYSHHLYQNIFLSLLFFLKASKTHNIVEECNILLKHFYHILPTFSFVLIKN